ncbi:hypothetical protein UCRNP2_1965 [Neofusicoccum parvum UCRNP2]|uniref:F-box domain-containing protein n=1 Tax=Botryosphaeria parva (strain UCR-NP2) TaxID=1287680 RepID=R1GSV4_BOTPV|nr:hypothetical protein UCRNP2_1965 [Neofusicoccum parvum UCRNP2]
MWNNLPNEVILDIVAGAAEFDFTMLRSLQLVDRRLHGILRSYERSLCRGYAANQLLRIIPCFPDIISPQCGICSNVGCASGLSFSLLASIQRRSATVSALARRVFTLAPVCRCLHGWHRLFEAGMLLLYRLQERPEYDGKVAFVAAMPLRALVAVFIALTQSLRAAQRGGAGLMHRDLQPDDASARSDIHLVFEDLVLHVGPEFVLDTLDHDEKADQYAGLDEAQMDAADGSPPRKSLISQLKRAFALRAGCRVGEVAGKAMALAGTVPLRDLGDAGVVGLVRFHEWGESEDV